MIWIQKKAFVSPYPILGFFSTFVTITPILSDYVVVTKALTLSPTINPEPPHVTV